MQRGAFGRIRKNPSQMASNTLRVEADQVHLVDREHEVRDAEQARDLRVTPRLVEHAVARVDEQDGDIGRRRAGRHVAGVLFVAGRVGENELPPRGREVAVGDVDRDALLTLGLQSVGEQREVDRTGRPVLRRRLDRVHLVLVHAARVVQQPADQRALAVVDAPGGADAKQAGHQK